MIVAPVKIRSLGFDWPGSKAVEEYEVSTAQGVDLDATLRSLEQGLSFYDGQLREIRDYAGRWNAEVTGPQGEYAAKAADLRRGIATIKEVLAKASH
jgi:hypothetical protein